MGTLKEVREKHLAIYCRKMETTIKLLNFTMIKLNVALSVTEKWKEKTVLHLPLSSFF